MANKKVGRPKGSKNKPKPTVNEITVEQLGAKMQKMLDDELAKRDSKNASVITQNKKSKNRRECSKTRILLTKLLKNLWLPNVKSF